MLDHLCRPKSFLVFYQMDGDQQMGKSSSNVIFSNVRCCSCVQFCTESTPVMEIPSISMLMMEMESRQKSSINFIKMLRCCSCVQCCTALKVLRNLYSVTPLNTVYDIYRHMFMLNMVHYLIKCEIL